MEWKLGVADGVPVIFDPAVYYGDRESDIAMTVMLFGGFGRNFYRAYGQAGRWRKGTRRGCGSISSTM